MKHNQDINKIILIIFIFVYLLSIMCGTTYCYPANIINETTNQHKIQSVVDLIEQKEYKKALTNLEQIENIDQCMFQFYKKQLAELLDNYKKILIDDANYYTANGDFAFALNLLNNKQKYFKDDKNIQALIEHNYNQVRKNKLTEYAGKIAILNTNCLLSFPSKALNPKNPLYEQFDNNHITPNEFKNILFSLYSNNYVLVDLKSLTQPIFVPENKKPVVLTFTNCSYEDKYKNKGLIDKIILDRNDNLATFTSKQKIAQRISYDNDFITILESFIKTYPDFSLNNAKGTICINGADGILGYKTQKSNATSRFEIKKALEVINRLKQSGWSFACNGYTGQNFEKINHIEFSKEVSSWINEVKNIIGNTNIFVSNCNYESLSTSVNDRYNQELLKEYKFSIYLQPSDSFNHTIEAETYIFDYINIGGEFLRNCPQNELFDPQKVYDHLNRNKPYNK